MKFLILPIRSFVRRLLKASSCSLRVVACGFFTVMYVSALANTYNVSTFADGTGSTTLRGAIALADGSAGPNTVNVPAGTYNLTMGTISFGDITNQNITIQGTGGNANIVMAGTGANLDRIFSLNYNLLSGVAVYFKNLTFTNGAAGGDTYAGGAVFGGGAGNIMDFNNCTFTNNRVRTDVTVNGGGSHGGAITCYPGGTLNVANCTFTGNTEAGKTDNSNSGSGGAIWYRLNQYGSTTPNGAVSITDSKFDGNITGTSGSPAAGQGGAVTVYDFDGQTFSGQTFTISILRNTFTNNKTYGTSAEGGAIFVGNRYNTNNINYNRFYGNTSSGQGSAVFANSTPGTIDASNNWWGCNSGGDPSTGCADKSYLLAGGGTLTIVPYLQFKTSTSISSLCPGATSKITSGFTVNSANNSISTTNLTAFTGLKVDFTATGGNVSPNADTIASGVTTTTFTAGAAGTNGTVSATVDNVPASDATASISIPNNGVVITASPSSTVTGCIGNTVTFTANGTGTPTPTFQWTKGGVNVANGPTGNGSTISGATGTVLTITNAQVADNGTYNFVSTNTCNSAISNNSALTISTAAMVSNAGSISGSSSISNTNTVINSSTCVPIANVVPSGGSPVSGTVTATATYDATVLRAPGKNPYVQRHYNIVPASNASTATATVTLYYLQKDFDNYDTTANHGLDLPKSTTDPEGNKANIRVVQYHGTGTAPGNYTGAGVTLVPTSVVYNTTLARWEVTVTVTGFSGFYLSNPNTVLPLTLLSFTGTAQNGNALLQWSTSNEVNTHYFEVMRSANGIDFVPIGQLPTTGNGNNGTNSYQYKDALGGSLIYYYQLKMVDMDGHFTTSSIVAINNTLVIGNGYLVQATPNPFQSKLVVSINAPSESQLMIELVDLNGKKILTQTKTISQGNNTISIDQLNYIANGAYLLHIFNGSVNQTIKIIKAK